MSLLQHLEQEAEHLLDIVKKAFNNEKNAFGAVNPKIEAIIASLESHISNAAPAPVVAPVVDPVVDTAPAPAVTPVEVAPEDTTQAS